MIRINRLNVPRAEVRIQAIGFALRGPGATDNSKEQQSGHVRIGEPPARQIHLDHVANQCPEANCRFRLGFGAGDSLPNLFLKSRRQWSIQPPLL